MTIHRGLVVLAALAGLLGTSRPVTASSDGDGEPSPGLRSAAGEVARYRRVAFTRCKKVPVLVCKVVPVRVLGHRVNLKVREILVLSVYYTAYRLVPESGDRTIPRLRMAGTRE